MSTYRIDTSRGEVFNSLEIQYPRTEAMDDAARALARAFEIDSANDPSYGDAPFISSITYVSSVVTTTTDAVPLAVETLSAS